MNLRDTILRHMKNNIHRTDYLRYIGNSQILFDFKYFSPLYNLSQERHIEYLKYFSIPFSEDLEELLTTLLSKKRISPSNITNVTAKFYLKMINLKVNLFLQLDEQSEDVVKIAILQDYRMLRYVENQDEKLINYIIANTNDTSNNIINDDFIDYIDNQTLEICSTVFKKYNQYSNHLKYVRNKTDEICLEAVKANFLSMNFFKNKTDENCEKIKQYHNVVIKKLIYSDLIIFIVYDERKYKFDKFDGVDAKHILYHRLNGNDVCYPMNHKEYSIKYLETKESPENTFIISDEMRDTISFYKSLHETSKNSFKYDEYHDTYFLLAKS